MTDTTDIAALKRPVRDRYDWSNAVWRDCDQCGKQHTGTVTAEDGSQICAHCADQLYWSAWQVLAERALDALEAERQRADAICRDIRIQANDLKSAQTVNKALQAELASLKGEQVPVAYTAECEISNMKATGLYLRAWPDDLRDSYNIPLYDRPQKPVVLPPIPAAIGDFTESAMKAVRRMDIAAIEAAGGIVKDGE